MNLRMYFLAFCYLLRFERFLRSGDFARLYQTVRQFPRSSTISPPDAAERICHAMDLLLVWYPKRVLCLQRAAATTCLLRRFGVPAQMVLGAQTLPFKAHAWVEVTGLVLNDKAYVKEAYLVLDCC